MKEKLALLKRIVNCLEDKDNKSIKLSLNNVYARGMFSLVVDGLEFGRLTRVFISDYKLNPFDVQLHTHRYPIKITTISGNIRHHIGKEIGYGHGCVEMSKFEYNSALNGGFGLKYIGETYVTCSDFMIPPISSIDLGITDFHTMSCSKGSIWIVEELGYEADSSYVLGKPFGVNTLYNEPYWFELESKTSLVLDKIKDIIKDYENVKN
jgi:hypothetical protein